MARPNDQVSTMAGEQSRDGSQSSSAEPTQDSNCDHSTSSTGSVISRVSFSTDTERPELSIPERTHSARRGVATAGLAIGTSGSSPSDIRKESLEIRPLRRPDICDSAKNLTEESRNPIALHNSSLLSASPTFPRQRNRGYSLRRQLFFRNAPNQVDKVVDVAQSSTNNMGIELTSKGKTAILHEGEGTNHDHPLRKDTLPSVAGSLPHYTLWARKQSYTLKGRIRSYFKNARNLLLRINEMPLSKEGRKILVGTRGNVPLIDERTGKEYISNTIRSSRYTVWSFLPKQLFAQFSKLANL